MCPACPGPELSQVLLWNPGRALAAQPADAWTMQDWRRRLGGRKSGVQGPSRCRTGSSAGLRGTTETRPSYKSGRLSCLPLLALSFTPSSSAVTTPGPDVPIWSLRPGGHSPCHSRTDSGVSAVTAPSAKLRGAPSRSSRVSDCNNSIANH